MSGISQDQNTPAPPTRRYASKPPGKGSVALRLSAYAAKARAEQQSGPAGSRTNYKTTRERSGGIGGSSLASGGSALPRTSKRLTTCFDEYSILIHNEKYSSEDLVVARSLLALPRPPESLAQVLEVVPTPQSDTSGNVATSDSENSKKSQDGIFRGSSTDNLVAIVHEAEDDGNNSQHFELSISAKLAARFSLHSRTRVLARLVPPNTVAADFIELTFRDPYLSRSEMWSIRNKLLSKCVFEDQCIQLAGGAVKVTVKAVHRGNRRVLCGFASVDTKLVFRSLACKTVIYLQLSQEMYQYDTRGELLFDKAIQGFLKELFQRWKQADVSHLVSIIVFARVYYRDRKTPLPPSSPTTKSREEHGVLLYHDFYQELLRWRCGKVDFAAVAKQVYQAAHSFKRVILSPDLIVSTFHAHRKLATISNIPEKQIDISLSEAHNSCILEAVNMALQPFDQETRRPRCGLSVIVVSAGCGVIHTTRELARLTTQRVLDFGIGLDLICLQPPPLHAVPIFKFRAKFPLFSEREIPVTSILADARCTSPVTPGTSVRTGDHGNPFLHSRTGSQSSSSTPFYHHHMHHGGSSNDISSPGHGSKRHDLWEPLFYEDPNEHNPELFFFSIPDWVDVSFFDHGPSSSASGLKEDEWSEENVPPEWLLGRFFKRAKMAPNAEPQWPQAKHSTSSELQLPDLPSAHVLDTNMYDRRVFDRYNAPAQNTVSSPTSSYNNIQDPQPFPQVKRHLSRTGSIGSSAAVRVFNIPNMLPTPPDSDTSIAYASDLIESSSLAPHTLGSASSSPPSSFKSDEGRKHLNLFHMNQSRSRARGRDRERNDSQSSQSNTHHNRNTVARSQTQRDAVDIINAVNWKRRESLTVSRSPHGAFLTGSYDGGEGRRYLEAAQYNYPFNASARNSSTTALAVSPDAGERTKLVGQTRRSTAIGSQHQSRHTRSETTPAEAQSREWHTKNELDIQNWTVGDGSNAMCESPLPFSNRLGNDKLSMCSPPQKGNPLNLGQPKKISPQSCSSDKRSLTNVSIRGVNERERRSNSSLLVGGSLSPSLRAANSGMSPYAAGPRGVPGSLVALRFNVISPWNPTTISAANSSQAVPTSASHTVGALGGSPALSVSSSSTFLSPFTRKRNASGRWAHVYPFLESGGRQLAEVKWYSLTAPGWLPLTTDVYPSPEELRDLYSEFSYTISPNLDYRTLDGKENCGLGTLDSRLKNQLMTQLISMRLAHGFQVHVSESAPVHVAAPASSEAVAPSSPASAPTSSSSSSHDSANGTPPSAIAGRLPGRVNSIITNAAAYHGTPSAVDRHVTVVYQNLGIPSTSTGTFYLTKGHHVHKLSWHADGQTLDVKRYMRKLDYKESSIDYRCSLWTCKWVQSRRSMGQCGFTPHKLAFNYPRDIFNWNLMDRLVSGYQDDDETSMIMDAKMDKDPLNFWKSRFVLIPNLKIPESLRSLQIAGNDSFNDEEVRLIGFYKFLETLSRAQAKSHPERPITRTERQEKPEKPERSSSNPRPTSRSSSEGSLEGETLNVTLTTFRLSAFVLSEINKDPAPEAEPGVVGLGKAVSSIFFPSPLRPENSATSSQANSSQCLDGIDSDRPRSQSPRNRAQSQSHSGNTRPNNISTATPIRDIVQRMVSKEGGLPIRSRRWHLRFYDKVFTGRECVEWLIKFVEGVYTREDAVTLGNKMLEAGELLHVNSKHKFWDGHYFYRLAISKSDEVLIPPGVMGAVPSPLSKSREGEREGIFEVPSATATIANAAAAVARSRLTVDSRMELTHSLPHQTILQSHGTPVGSLTRIDVERSERERPLSGEISDETRSRSISFTRNRIPPPSPKSEERVLGSTPVVALISKASATSAAAATHVDAHLRPRSSTSTTPPTLDGTGSTRSRNRNVVTERLSREANSDIRAYSRRSGSRRPYNKIAMTKQIVIDLDPHNDSDRTEHAVLHFSSVHNPKSCYHLQIEWIHCTPQLLDDTITGWKRLANNWGLKLVETPLEQAELLSGDLTETGVLNEIDAGISRNDPFRPIVFIPLALQPPAYVVSPLVDAKLREVSSASSSFHADTSITSRTVKSSPASPTTEPELHFQQSANGSSSPNEAASPPATPSPFQGAGVDQELPLPPLYFLVELVKSFGFVWDLEPDHRFPKESVTYSYKRGAPTRYPQFIHHKGNAFVLLVGEDPVRGLLYVENRYETDGEYFLGKDIKPSGRPNSMLSGIGNVLSGLSSGFGDRTSDHGSVLGNDAFEPPSRSGSTPTSSCGCSCPDALLTSLVQFCSDSDQLDRFWNDVVKKVAGIQGINHFLEEVPDDKVVNWVSS